MFTVNKRGIVYILIASLCGLYLLFAACDSVPTKTEDVVSPETPMILIAPNGGETYKIGDSLTIKWRANPDSAKGMLINISFDAGRTYYPINDNQSIGVGGGRDTSVQWQIPDSLFDFPTRAMVPVPVSSLCKVRISDYFGKYTTYSAQYFSVIR
jgi:hypothetical protein